MVGARALCFRMLKRSKKGGVKILCLQFLHWRFCILPYLAAVEGVDPSKRLLIARTEFEGLLSSCKHNFYLYFSNGFGCLWEAFLSGIPSLQARKVAPLRYLGAWLEGL